MRKILVILLIVAALATGAYLGRVKTRHRPAIAGPALIVSCLGDDFGNATVLRTPEGRFLVIDPGPRRTADALAGYLKDWGARSISILLSNSSADHVGAVEPLMNTFVVLRVFRGEPEGRSGTWRRTMAAVRDRKIPVAVLSESSTVTLTKSTTITVLGPPTGLLKRAGSYSDDNSLVTRVSFGDKSFLFPSDIRTAGEAHLILSGTDLRSDVLMVARHGRYGSTSLELLREVRPGICIVSVDSNNGGPSRQLLNRIGKRNTGADVYRTDKDGIVNMATDGRSIVANTEGLR